MTTTESTVTQGDVVWKFADKSDGTATLVGYDETKGSKPSGNVVLPDKSGMENRVVYIKNHAVEGCDGITSVEVPEGVTEIGVGVFKECTALQSVSLPNTLRSIGGYAFQGTKLVTVNIPDEVERIGVYAFNNCLSLQSVKLPNGLKTISWRMFKDDTALTSVVIPNEIETIDKEAFDGCQKLDGIKLPNTLTAIKDGAFRDTGLTEITVPDSVSSIGEDAFRWCLKLKKVTLPKKNERDFGWNVYIR